MCSVMSINIGIRDGARLLSATGGASLAANYLYDDSTSLNSYEQQQPQSGGEQQLSPCGRNWPRLFLIWSAVSMGCCIANSVGSIIFFFKYLLNPTQLLLDVYILIFCFLALSAELWRFRLVRRVARMWLKHVYFLTTYSGRSLFYIFIGTLVIDFSVFNAIVGGICIALGVSMFVVNLIFTLPVYVDEVMMRERQKQQLEEEKRQKMRMAAEGISSSEAYSLYETPHAASDPMASSATPSRTATYGYAKQDGTQLGGYVPPAPNAGPNAL